MALIFNWEKQSHVSLNSKGDSMYEGGKGAGAVATGSVILPNTGGNRVLTAIAVTSIAVGVAIVVTTIVRFAVNKAHKA